MSFSKLWFCIVSCGAAAILSGTQALAGVVITGRSTQTGNGPAQEHVHIVMIQGHQERIESGQQATLIDVARGTIVVLNAATKTYTESVLKSPTSMTTVPQPSRPRFEPTGDKRTIAGYECQVFKTSSTSPHGDQTITGCFSSAVPGWTEYRELNAMLTRKTAGDAAVAELPPGLPLSVETSLKRRYQLSPQIDSAHRAEMERIVAGRPPVVSEDLVTEIKLTPLSPSLFAIPPGYTKLRIAGPLEH